MKTSNKRKNNKIVKNKKNKQTKIQNIKLRRILAAIITLIALLTIAVLILFSSLFSIKQITVVNNSKVSTEEIIQSSKLIIGNNMFKTFNSEIKEGVKSNPYIESLKISKKFNGEVVITVQERKPTFMLKIEDDYAYINNQGYILEISAEVISTPIIIGYSTLELVPGNRLDIQDLKKLDSVIQIVEAAKGNNINELITTIDITDANNYILEIPSEGKTVQFGNTSNINVKILWIKDLIEREKGVEGEIVLNVSNIKKVYFREKV